VFYICPSWQFEAEHHVLKLQRLQNKVLLTTGKFPRGTPVCEWHMVFQVPYIFDYKMKLCSQQAEVIQNHENADVRDIGKGEA
jgi:hypothetical protein